MQDSSEDSTYREWEEPRGGTGVRATQRQSVGKYSGQDLNMGSRSLALNILPSLKYELLIQWYLFSRSSK
jgi:hypothetical protein